MTLLLDAILILAKNFELNKAETVFGKEKNKNEILM